MSFFQKLKNLQPYTLKLYNLKKQELNLIHNKISELKLSPDFLAELNKPRTGVIYKNDFLFLNNLSNDFMNNQKIKENFHNIKSLGRGLKLIDANFLEFVKSLEKENFSKIDLIILYKVLMISCINILNPKISHDTLNKIYSNMKDYSQYDPLYISTKIDEALIFFRTTNNFKEIRNQLIEQIAKAKITDQPYLEIKGWLILAQLYMSTNQNIFSNVYCSFGEKLYNKQKYNDENLLKKILLLKINNMKESKFKKITKNLDPEIREVVLADYYTSCAKNININNPKSIYKSWKVIHDLLESVNTKQDPHHPALVVLLSYYWILSYKLGRESIANFYLEKAKNLLASNSLLEENFYFRFYVLLISEASNFELPQDIVFSNYKNLNTPNKLCFDMLLFRSFSLYYSVLKGDEKETVLSKYNELNKLYEIYFGGKNESILPLERKLQEVGYL